MSSRLRFAFVTAAAWLVIGPSWLAVRAARAEDADCQQAVEQARATRVREARAAERFVAGLRLSRGQARQLLPILDKAAALQVASYERKVRLQTEILTAFEDFAREDSFNRGFSPEVERRTGRVNHQAKEAQEQLEKELIGLEERAAAILTTTQKQRASDGPGRAVQAMAKAVRQHSARTRRDAQAGGDDRLAAVRRELGVLHAEQHPKLGKLGRQLLHPTAAQAVAKIAGERPTDTMRQAAAVFERGTSEYPQEESLRQQMEIDRLRAEINHWNLINGLHLSCEQIERIVGLYDASAPNGVETRRNARRTAEVSPTLVVALERAVEDVLNPGQRQVLADYKACLIPPKNLKDPVRIGQANDNSHIEKWLERARTASGPALTRLINRALDEEVEHVAPLTPVERKNRELLLSRTARTAAGMSDTQFELNKADLAQQIAPRDRKKELTTELVTLSRARGLPTLVARHMLNDGFIEQLRQRGRQLAAGVTLESANLSQGPQAENCEKGCALPGIRRSRTAP